MSGYRDLVNRFGKEPVDREIGKLLDGFKEPDECGHDGWQAGCPKCEAEHALALSLIGDTDALD